MCNTSCFYYLNIFGLVDFWGMPSLPIIPIFFILSGYNFCASYRITFALPVIFILATDYLIFFHCFTFLFGSGRQQMPPFVIYAVSLSLILSAALRPLSVFCLCHLLSLGDHLKPLTFRLLIISCSGFPSNSKHMRPASWSS